MFLTSLASSHGAVRCIAAASAVAVESNHETAGLAFCSCCGLSLASAVSVYSSAPIARFSSGRPSAIRPWQSASRYCCLPPRPPRLLGSYRPPSCRACRHPCNVGLVFRQQVWHQCRVWERVWERVHVISAFDCELTVNWSEDEPLYW